MAGTGTSGKTVLVADDTAFVRDRFSAAIADAGHRAVTVQTAGELLARLRQELEHIDLIVADLRLPQSRGTDLVRAIRQLDGGRIPILIFSGTIASADEVRELSALGVAGYVNEYSAVPHIVPHLAPHLFPDSFNRRGSPRVNVSLPISYRVGNTIASALTLTLGKGGVGIRSMNPLERGIVAHLRFRLPGASHDVEADARVRWTDRNIGMGLQFERISPADQVAIDEFVDGHFFSNRKA
jgi:CheY-like chemotaxis protein